jgi:hypothetical protein
MSSQDRHEQQCMSEHVSATAHNCQAGESGTAGQQLINQLVCICQQRTGAAAAAAAFAVSDDAKAHSCCAKLKHCIINSGQHCMDDFKTAAG